MSELSDKLKARAKRVAGGSIIDETDLLEFAAEVLRELAADEPALPFKSMTALADELESRYPPPAAKRKEKRYALIHANTGEVSFIKSVTPPSFSCLGGVWVRAPWLDGEVELETL